MAQKMLFCFTNISAEIVATYFRLQLLCGAPYFGTFLPNANASKHPKLLAQKLVCHVTKYVGEINSNWWQKLIPD
jgi:hypothetical protein